MVCLNIVVNLSQIFLVMLLSMSDPGAAEKADPIPKFTV